MFYVTSGELGLSLDSLPVSLVFKGHKNYHVDNGFVTIIAIFMHYKVHTFFFFSTSGDGDSTGQAVPIFLLN